MGFYVLFCHSERLYVVGNETHLSDSGVQVVHDHYHYSCCLACDAWILIYGISPGETACLW